MLRTTTPLDKSRKTNRLRPSLWRSLACICFLFLFYATPQASAQCPGTPCSADIVGPLAIEIQLNSPSAVLNNTGLSNIISPAGGCGYPGGTAVFDFLVFDAIPALGDMEPAGIRDFDCDSVGMTFTRYIVLEDNTMGTDDEFDECDAQPIEITVTVVDASDPTIINGDGPDCDEVVDLNTSTDYDYTAAVIAGSGSSLGDCFSTLEWQTPDFTDNCGIDSLAICFSAQGSPGPSVLPANIGYGPNSTPVPGIPLTLSADFYGHPDGCTDTTKVTYKIYDPSGQVDSCHFYVVVSDDEDPVWNDPSADIVDSLSADATVSSLEDWDPFGAGDAKQVRVVLDCNSPFYAQDSAYLASWLPTASDNCDTTVTVAQNHATANAELCVNRLGIDNIYARFAHFFTAEDNCTPPNALDHDVVANDNDGDDERFRLVVLTADSNAPWLDQDSVGVTAPVALDPSVSPNPAITGTAALGYDFTFTGDTVKFNIVDPVTCALVITSDTLSIEGIDCQDVMYSWEVTASVTQFDTPTGLAGTTSDVADDNDIVNGPSTTSISNWPAGTHDIEYTAVDDCGNISTFDFVLQICDTIPPAIADCPPSSAVNDTICAVANTGLCETTVAWIVPTPTDCSGISSFTATATDPGGVPITINTGNTPGGTCVDIFNFTGIFDVANWITTPNGTGGTVDDSGAPNSVDLDIGNGDEVEYEFIGIVDNGVIVFDYAMFIDPAFFSSLTLSYSVDGGGSFIPIDVAFRFFSFPINASGTIQIPVSTGDHFILRLEETGPGGGVATISAFSFHCNQAAFADFPVGTSCVEYIAIDGVGNADTCKFYVKVQDLQAPYFINPTADQTLFMDEIDCSPIAGPVPDYTYLANVDDNCVVDSITQSPAAGEALPLAAIGHDSMFNVVLTAWSYGLMTMDTFKVTLVDNVVPTIALCPNDTILYTDITDCNTAYSYAAPKFNDDCDGTNLDSNSSTGPASGADFPLGVTTVTHTYTDDNGNAATCTFTVEVRDTVPPVFGSPIPNVTANTSDDDTGDCDVAITFSNPAGVTDNCTGAITYSFNPPSGSLFSVGTHPVIVTATDVSNNSSTSSFNVIVSDDEDPEIFNCPADFDITSVCDSITVPQLANNVSDNCAIDTVIQVPEAGTYLIDVLGAGNVVDGATFVVKQYVWDMATNVDSCETTITLNDLNQPVPDETLLDIYYSCDTLYLDPPTASTCDGQTINGVLNGVPFINGQYCFAPPFDAPVSWSYTNPVNNQTTAQVQHITVTTDTTKASIACPMNATFPTAIDQCDTTGLAGMSMAEVDIFSFSGAAGTYADTCGIDEVEYALSGATDVARKVGDDAGTETFEHGVTTVTYYVTDIHNNTATCSFTVTVKDMQDPVLVGVPADTLVNCDAVPDPAMVTATDNCSPADSIDIAYTSTITAGSCPYNYTITRMWTATDTCDNSTSLTQVLTVQDTVPPVFAGVVDSICMSNTPGQCDAQVVLMVGASNVSDNCALGVDVTNNVFPANGADASGVYPVGTTYVTFTAVDSCSNSSTHVVKVVIKDDEDPEMVCVNINLPINSSGTASIDSSDVVISFGDNCSDDSDLTFTVTPNTFTCADIVNSPIDVTITATDEAGNVATCTASVTLQENVIPTAVCQDITVYLDADGNVTVNGSDLDGGSTDNCMGQLEFTINGLPSRDYDCDDILISPFQVTMEVEDPAGNTDDCLAMITIVDTINPTVICQNISVYLDGNGDASIVGADVNNGSSDACGIASMSVDPDAFTCMDLGPNSVDLTVVDNNGNSATETCTVTVLDTLAPLAMCMDLTVNLDANGTKTVPASDLDDGTTDNCTDAADIVFTNGGSGDLSLDCMDIGETIVTMTATDEEDNSSTCTSVLTVLPPEVVSFTAGSATGPAGGQVDIPVTADDFYVMRSFQFSVHIADASVATIDSIVSNISGSLVSSNTGPNDRSVTWNSATNAGLTLTDGDTVFFVRVTLVGASGDMSDVVIDDDPTPANVSQGCGPTPYITDVDLISPGTVTIDANTSSIISGTITREGDPVNLVEVTMTGDVSGMVTTGPGGTYSFVVPNGSTVTITPKKDIFVLNGLNAADGAIIRAHIAAGVPVIMTPYRMLAADVDLSSAVPVMDPTAADAGIIQNVIAGNFPDFHIWGNDSWRFVPHSHTFTPPAAGDPWNPWLTAVPDSETITSISSNQLVDFEGIKNGDVDAFADPQQFVTGDPVYVAIEDQALVAGEEYTIHFNTKDFTDMVAYQFTLEFDTEVLSFVETQTGALSNLVFGLNETTEGRLAAVWSEAQPTALTETDAMFSIKFIANANVEGLEGLFAISDQIAESIAFRSDFDPIDVELVLSGTTPTINLNTYEFALYQNHPNPFKAETSIGFSLPTSGQATFSVFDISGKLVYQSVDTYDRGYNEISLQRGELPQKGLLYYQLDSSDGTATRKMMMLE